jgi:F-box-like
MTSRRFVRTGDYVIISVPGKLDTKYVISMIDQTNIYIHPEKDPSKISLIVPDTSSETVVPGSEVGWKVDGTDFRFGIRFERADEDIKLPQLTGNRDIDVNILVMLDDTSLSKACQVNRYLAELCRDDNLWRRKMEFRFPTAMKLKDTLKTIPRDDPHVWKKLYQIIAGAPRNRHRVKKTDESEIHEWIISTYDDRSENDDSEAFYAAVSDGNVTEAREYFDIFVKYHDDKDVLFSDHYYRFSYNLAESMASMLENPIPILEFLHLKNFDHFDDIALRAIEHGRLDILKWIQQKWETQFLIGDDNIDNLFDAIEMMLENGENDFEMFVLLDDMDLLESDMYYVYVEMTTNPEIIEWIGRKGHFSDKLKDTNTAELSSEDAMTFLKSIGYHSDDIVVNAAAAMGNVNLLDTMEQKGFLPSKFGITNASLNKHINVLEWAATRNILPTPDDANLAVYENLTEVLNWMAKHGIAPTQEGANNAVMTDNWSLVKWMTSFGIYPDQTQINNVSWKGHIDTFRYLFEKGILPDQGGITLIVTIGQDNQIEMLNLLASKGLLPTIDDANNVLAYSENPRSDPILRWMAGRGIYPNKPQEKAYKDIQMEKYPNLYPQ